MQTKYKDYFDRMIRTNKDKFDKFNKLYNEYIKNQDDLQEKYNQGGKEILNIIREWENKLCSQTEKAGYGNYSTKLSEKFWTEVRKTYPLIDYVGVLTKNNKKSDNFMIKKIKLL